MAPPPPSSNSLLFDADADAGDDNNPHASSSHASSSRLDTPPAPTATPPRRDVRFAIDDEDDGDGEGVRGADDADDDEEGEDDRDHLIRRGDSSSSPASSKYPPPLPTSLPPSYREAVFKKDPWYKSEVALSLQHYGRICFSGVGGLFRRYWPTSRFAQAGFFIVGLWIIVIVTGPTWDKSARLGWGKSVDEFLASIPPPPVSGDGHFTSLADWSIPSCRSTPSGLSTYCSRTSTYKLPIPHEKDAFMTSDKIFLFVDPPRNHQSEDRGRIPASVQVKMDGNTQGQVKVVVKARYEKQMEPLLERANVGMMKSGLVDQGVGIYTWPLPARLQELTVRDPAQFPYPLLSFDITIHVEPHSEIPNFLVEGARMDVGFFTDVEQTTKLSRRGGDGSNNGHAAAAAVAAPPVRLSDATREKLSHARFGHAMGVAMQKRAEEAAAIAGNDSASTALDRASTSPSPASPPTSPQPHTLFGSIVLNTGEGNLAIADNVGTMGQTVLKTHLGHIRVAPSTSLRSTELHLETSSGDVHIGEASTLEAQDILQVISRDNGSVVADARVHIKGTRVNGEAAAGALTAPSAQWTTNHTLLLKSRDDVVTLLGVEPPWRPALGQGTEQHPWVSVDVTSASGRADVRFAEHVRNTPLRGKFAAQKATTLELHPEYAGSFTLTAPAASSSDSRVTPPDDHSPAAVAAAVERNRVFEVKDASTRAKVAKSGEVWWQLKSMGSTKPTGEDWGSVDVSASDGAAVLGFDAV